MIGSGLAYNGKDAKTGAVKFDRIYSIDIS